MTKTNFTKVEEALAEGLRRIQLDKLLVEADQARAKVTGTEAPAKPITSQELEDRKRKAQGLKITLKWLHSKDDKLYTKLKVDKTEVNKFLDRTDAYNEKELQIFTVLCERVEAVKKEVTKREGTTGDDDLIAQQRKKHITKRFNVQDKWLPLK